MVGPCRRPGGATHCASLHGCRGSETLQLGRFSRRVWLVSAFHAGGLVEPPIVPRFMDALAAAGGDAVRVPAYLTSLGLPGPECCAKEAALLQQGYFDAIAFSSTAEVGGGRHMTCIGSGLLYLAPSFCCRACACMQTAEQAQQGVAVPFSVLPGAAASHIP